MPSNLRKGVFLVALAAGWGSLRADPRDHVYQYAVPVGSSEAYLWIPPSCDHVRGIIIALDNMLERQWLEGPILRETAAADHLAVVWVGPARDRNIPGINADMTGGAGDSLVAMLDRLAVVSGYPEIASAPLIPTGHSAHGQFSWKVAAWDPSRVIAAVAVKTVPLPDSLGFTGVPLCYMVGQTTEWPEYRDGRPGDRDFFWPLVRRSALALRRQNPGNLVGVVVDPGGGHFDWSGKLGRFLALYIDQVCRVRLPSGDHGNGPVKLRKLSPGSGWLTGAGAVRPDRFPPAAFARYGGDPADAYWWPTRKVAEAARDFGGDRKPREKQLVTFLENGRKLPVAKTGFASPAFRPAADGVTFRVQGGFLDSVPAGLTGAGTPLGHGDSTIRFYVITGPAVRIAPRTFRVRFDRGGPGPVWIEASQPADARYRHAVQPAQVSIPMTITRGKNQLIRFAAPGNQPEGTSFVLLHGTSDAGLPVRYYVDAGPAYVTGDTLRFTPLPPKSRYPVKVTVVAYQWGRVWPPYVKTAEPVTRTFNITRR